MMTHDDRNICLIQQLKDKIDDYKLECQKNNELEKEKLVSDVECNNQESKY